MVYRKAGEDEGEELCIREEEEEEKTSNSGDLNTAETGTGE